MANSLNKYIKAIYDLLPKGFAWNDDTDSNFYKLVGSIAPEFCRIDDRLDDLLREVDPFQTTELLIDFENMLGLPDSCLEGIEMSIQDRRDAVIAAIAALGGSNCDYFESIALSNGFTVACTDFFAPFVAGSRAGDRLTNGQSHFVAGSRAGDRLYNTGWTFWWEIHSDEEITTKFRAGSRAGERLTVFGNERLECLIQKRKPAHTNVLFTYGP